MVWCEHHADGRDRDVEDVVLERKILRVCHLPVEVDTQLSCLAPTTLEQLRRDVSCHNASSKLRRGDCRVPGASRHVEYILTGPHTCGLNDDAAKCRDYLVGHSRVVAQRP
jgi:hypothetical protein